MDVGASTGGFTDCMLQNGGVKVYSIDVGYGQLDWKLRNDPRVVCMEKTNIRYVVPEDIQEKPAFSSIDVSFISLTKVLGPVRNLLTEDGEIVCLIKPQFEVPRNIAAKTGGVIRSDKWRAYAIDRAVAAMRENGFDLSNVISSPIRGGSGNEEFLAHFVPVSA